MNDIQFEVITDLAVINPQHIQTNFEDVDAYLTEAMEPYTQLVVTEDSIGDAKKTLAQLRKLKDGINTVDGEEIFYISNPALGLWVCDD